MPSYSLSLYIASECNIYMYSQIFEMGEQYKLTNNVHAIPARSVRGSWSVSLTTEYYDLGKEYRAIFGANQWA